MEEVKSNTVKIEVSLENWLEAKQAIVLSKLEVINKALTDFIVAQSEVRKADQNEVIIIKSDVQQLKEWRAQRKGIRTEFTTFWQVVGGLIVGLLLAFIIYKLGWKK